jgi:hypothetical protein
VGLSDVTSVWLRALSAESCTINLTDDLSDGEKALRPMTLDPLIVRNDYARSHLCPHRPTGSPDSAPTPLPGRSPTGSACEPYFDFIELSLSNGRNAKAIYQDLVDSHGFTGRYASVKRFVSRSRGQSAPYESG